MDIMVDQNHISYGQAGLAAMGVQGFNMLLL